LKNKTVYNKGIEPTGNSLSGFFQSLVAPVGSCSALTINRVPDMTELLNLITTNSILIGVAAGVISVLFGFLGFIREGGGSHLKY